MGRLSAVEANCSTKSHFAKVSKKSGQYKLVGYLS